MATMHSVVHFEMPADDLERMKAFYSKSFGWQLQQMGPEMGGYVLATTTETDRKGRPKQPGAINGGFYKRSPEASKHPSVVVAVDDLRAAMRRVAKQGGKVMGEPQEIPGIGLWVGFEDTEGNRLSMLQPPAER